MTLIGQPKRNIHGADGGALFLSHGARIQRHAQQPPRGLIFAERSIQIGLTHETLPPDDPNITSSPRLGTCLGLRGMLVQSLSRDVVCLIAQRLCGTNSAGELSSIFAPPGDLLLNSFRSARGGAGCPEPSPNFISNSDAQFVRHAKNLPSHTHTRVIKRKNQDTHTLTNSGYV